MSKMARMIRIVLQTELYGLRNAADLNVFEARGVPGFHRDVFQGLSDGGDLGGLGQSLRGTLRSYL